MKRVILIVMDSVGIGELPDAEKYGDSGSNTLGNIAKAVTGFKLTNLEKLGLGNIEGVTAFEKVPSPEASFGRMAESSAGKDTTTGHWELAGIIVDRPFPTYPEGFPMHIIDEFEKAIGTKTLGNYPASGTEIIERLGDEHIRTGCPIVYTSADSVFQIAAHEEVIPVSKLYEISQKARTILKDEHAVARVIARPFTGKSGEFVRTGARHDFSLEPYGTTILDLVSNKGLRVKGVGKISDIFNGRGITDSVKTTSNMDGVDKTLAYIKEEFEGMIFTNLVDFDMNFGHRNDVEGYAKALSEFDKRIPEVLEALKEGDILMITADHGCDPTTPSTDHSREYVPLLVYGNKVSRGINIGTRTSFADIGATIAQYLNVGILKEGTSFLNRILELA